MNFLNIIGFDAKEGKAQELQKWLAANEEKLAAEAPAGTEYVGTFAAVLTSEKQAGSFFSVWRMESYGAMDSFSAEMKKGGAFTRLMEEMTELIDESRDANWSSVIGRRVTDAAIWGN